MTNSLIVILDWVSPN